MSGSRTRVLEFPSNYAIPLVKFERQISVTLYPLCIVYENVLEQVVSRSYNIDLQGYMTVSDVGRRAIGSSKSELPLENNMSTRHHCQLWKLTPE
jgi:hypothetical protein